jgi:hypothetical protein
MAKKKAAPKKARPEKTPPKKNVPKKAAAKSSAGRINVFSRAFTTMTHRAAAGVAPVLIVECNIDGDLRDDDGNIATFNSLDRANDFGAAHRRDKGPSHKCIVKTSQRG